MFDATLKPTGLTLSNDSAIESVLTDIPFLCVGLMTFAVFTFVLAMKRINPIAIYLYASAFLAFIAAILDLSQILARGATNTANGIGLSSVWGLINVREVGLALSVGFIYLFMWYMIAQCPRDELGRIPDGAKTRYDYRSRAHSASWQRWGVLGLLLKWCLLGLSISIPVLQIVWRVSTSGTRFGVVYVAEATIEVVVSALFILKVFLNIFLSPLTPWWQPLRSYLVTIVALLINGGLGVGNLVATEFSETILGRFLRAIEMYILILFVLISTFYQTSASPTISRVQKTDVSFVGLPEKTPESSFRVSPPVPQSPDIVVGRPVVTPDGGLKPFRASAMSRLSLLRGPPIPVTREQRLDQDLELGLAITRRSEDSIRYANVRENQSTHDVDAYNLALPDDGQTPTSNRPFTSVSIASYYGMERNPSILYPMPAPPLPSRQTDSPVYGLNGIISQDRNKEVPYQPHNSETSFDELLRQQTELETSIAILQRFSPRAKFSMPNPTEVRPSIIRSRNSGNLEGGSNSASSLSYLGRKPDSASNHSEFSLSIFPKPPVEGYRVLPYELNRSASRSSVSGRETNSLEVIPTKTLYDGMVSLSASWSSLDKTARFESAATQYDVTSFIGGLTTPSNMVTQPRSYNSATRLSDVESEDELAPPLLPAASRSTMGVRATIVGSTLPAFASQTSLGPATASSGPLTGPPREEVPQLRREPSMLLRPFLLGPSSPPGPLASLSSTKIPIGPRRPRGGGLPSNPRRPMISAPTMSAEDSIRDQTPGAFERPRPPPLRFVRDI